MDNHTLLENDEHESHGHGQNNQSFEESHHLTEPEHVETPKKPKRHKILMFGFIIPLMVIALICWVFYVVVFIVCTSFTVSFVGVACAILFGFSWALLFISYVRVIITNPGDIPVDFENTELFKKYYELEDEECRDSTPPQEESNTIQIEGEQKRLKGYKCFRCDKVRPIRSHHCSACGKCVLKMDHHCPWINNCVGFFNQKFFVCFLFWVSVASLIGLATNIFYMIDLPSLKLLVRDGNGIQVIIATWVCFVFGFGLVGFCITHCNLVSNDRTTLEGFKERRKRSWGYSKKENWINTMGKNPLVWFLPIYTTKGNGIYFKRFESESN